MICRYGLASSYDDIPDSIMNEFRSYDFDADGNIDPYEFIGISSELAMDSSRIPLNTVSLLLNYDGSMPNK